jgi:hypothetical protein
VCAPPIPGFPGASRLGTLRANSVRPIVLVTARVTTASAARRVVARLAQLRASEEDVFVRVEVRPIRVPRAGCQGDIKQTSRCKKRDKTKKRATPKNIKENKNKTEAEGLLPDRQKAWTCGLAWRSISPLFFKPSKPAPNSKAPAAPGFALRLRRPGGPIEIEIRGVGGERATRTCFCVARAVLLFACVRPPPPKNRQTGPRKKKKNAFYIALCRVLFAMPSAARCPPRRVR